MKFFIPTFIVLAFAAVAMTEPEPEPAKASRYRAAQFIADDINDEKEQAVDAYDQSEKDEVAVNDSSKKADAASGRLFMRKFLLFKNMFGQNQKQPIIPIIITGGNSNTGLPTTTPITTGGAVPPASGTVTSEPTTPTNTVIDTGAGGAGGAVPPGRIQLYGRGTSDEDDKESHEDDAIIDEHTLAAALAAGAEEYVVTDQEIKGTSDAKANSAPARINLRRRGAKRGRVVSVRVPARYRGYFKNGQRVILKSNQKNRPAKRRVIKRRNNNRRRNNKNKNKRRRIVVS